MILLFYCLCINSIVFSLVGPDWKYLYQNINTKRLQERPLLNTSFGTLVGFNSDPYPGRRKFNRPKVNSTIKSEFWPRVFTGVPYALSTKRFERVVPWNGTFKEVFNLDSNFLKSDMYSPQCYQNPLFTIPYLFSEDCLFLNIYLPSKSKLMEYQAKGKLFPIMVWVPGGGFEIASTGTGNAQTSWFSLYDGANAAYTQDVIVITVNFRLGIFGFLHSSNIPANNGLYDIKESIRWIYNQASYMNGDKNQITVFGLSSGATTCGYLLQDTSNDTVPISRYILMSSPAALNLRPPDSTLMIYNEVLNATNCLHFKSELEELDCLKKKTPFELIYYADTSNETLISNIIDFPERWIPTVDLNSEFTDQRTMDLMNNVKNMNVSDSSLNTREHRLRSKLKNVELILGVTHDEGSLFLAFFELFGHFRGGTYFFFRGNQTAYQYLSRLMHGPDYKIDPSFDATVSELVSGNSTSFIQLQYIYFVSRTFHNDVLNIKKILDRYPPTDNITKNVETMINIVTDYSFLCPNLNMAKSLSQLTQGVYFYQFTAFPDWVPVFNSKGSFPGVTHASDLPYFFNKFPKVPQAQQGLVQIYQGYFGSFAHGLSLTNVTVNSTVGSKQLPSWSKFDTNSRYLNIGSPLNWASEQPHMNNDNCVFWESIRTSTKNIMYPF